MKNEGGVPQESLRVYAFNGTSYTGYNKTTDADGETIFTLSQGEYRFRADSEGEQFWSDDTNHCTIPGCLSAAVTVPGGIVAETTVITYTYDPLYRLTAADYDNGDSFDYTYDSTGNRLTKETEISGQSSVSSYQYDVANRLVDVDGIPYAWDANGNLLNDGANTYVYNHANRLTAVSDQSSVSSYQYNGLGDRVSQTVNGENTTYTLDLAIGLTQVLSDGENSYLYGMGRIGEQSPGGWAYHHGDALGSVRQLTDAAGAVTLAQSYMPYGYTLSIAGSGNSVFQFTGEMRDGSGLTFLRARYLDTGVGRFTQKDPSGLEHNLYLYAGANPIGRIDPTGLFSTDQIASSMGVSAFDTLMYVFAITPPPLLLPDDDKWGFFSALLDAEDGDTLQIGSSLLITPHPRVQYRRGERLWLKDCNQIMVGSRPLDDFFYRVLLQPTKHELPAEFWRDTSPSYYLLGKSNMTSFYVDGSSTTDLPDFHSVDIGFWQSGRNVSVVVDRFGNKYLGLGLGAGIGGGAFYSEGYICSSPSTCLDDNLQPYPITWDENTIRGTLEQGCGGVSVILDGGASYILCMNENLSSAIIYSFGLGLSGSANISFGFWVGKDEQMGWNKMIEDRLNGVTYVDLMVKAKTK